LAAIGPDKSLVPVYLAALKERDSGVRQSALLALGQLTKELDKEKDKETIAAIVDAAKDSDAQVRKTALTAVGKLGPTVITPAAAKTLMPPLIEVVQGKDAAARDDALETIAGLGPLAKDAVVPLINLMEKRDVKVYVNRETKAVFIKEEDDQYLDKIAKTIGKIGRPAVTLLTGSMNTTNVNAGLFIGCCRALGEIGPPARNQQTIAMLQAISQGPHPPPVCSEADRALRKIVAK
jgi:hypothetical protein